MNKLIDANRHFAAAAAMGSGMLFGPRINFAPPDDLGGGGGGGNDNGGGNDPNQSGNGNQGQGDDGLDLSGFLGDEDEAGGDLAEILASFGGTNEDNLDDTEQPEIEGFSDASPEEIQELGRTVGNLISRIAPTADLIPENFDANDRDQLQQLLTKTMQQTTQQAMSVVFKPMQLAMATLAKQATKMMDQKISAAQTGMESNAILTSEVPELKDPRFKPFLDPMNEALIRQKKTPRERASIMRRTLNQMGVKPKAPNQRNSSQANGDNASIKHGKAALDSLFEAAGAAFK